MPWTGPIENVEFSEPSVSGTTITFSPLATIQAGTLITLGYAVNVTGSAQTAADNSSQPGTANTYTPNGGSNSGTLVSGGDLYCVTTRAILPTDVITLTCSAATRRNGRMLTWHGQLASPFDKTNSVTGVAASPITVAAGAALADVGELSVMWSFWTGGAVLSGCASNHASYTLAGVAAGSGGVTTRVEVNASYRTDAGTAADSPSHSFTSFTSGAGEYYTFKAGPFRRIKMSVLPFTQGAGGGGLRGGPH